MGCGSSKGPYPAGLPAGAGDLPDGVQILGQNDAAAVQETSDMAGRSFAGTASAAPPAEFDWLFGPELSDRTDPTQQKERAHCASASMAVCVHFAFQLGDRGLVLVARDTSEGNKIVGHVVIEFHPVGWKPLGSFAQMKAVMNAGASKWTKAQQDFTSSKRDKALQKVLSSLHKAHASGPHMYVLAVAVDPDAQGKGVGGKLMRAINKIADAAKLPLYLECDSGKNEAVYQKFGYTTVGKEKVEKVDGSEMPGEMCAMRRECA